MFVQRIKNSLAVLRSRLANPDPLTRRILAGLFGFLLFGLFVSGLKIISMEPVAGAFLTGSRSDFDDYYQAATRLRSTGDLYNLDRMRRLEAEGADPADPRRFQGLGSYLYPPLTAWLLLPLSFFDYKLAAFVYQCLSIVALGGFFYFVRRRLPGSAGADLSRFFLAAVLALLLLYQFLLGNADNGNIGFFLIVLGGVGLILAFDERPLPAFCGGLLLGLATVMKITPAFFVLPLIAGGRVRAVLGMGAGGLAGLALPALSLGWERNLTLLADWYGFLIANFQKWSIVRPWANNQTVSAAVGKLLIVGADMKQGQYGLPLFFRALPDEPTRNLIISGVRGANLFLYGLALVSALRLWSRGTRRPGSPLIDADGARLLLLALLCSLAASGVSWYHAYCVLLLPVFFRLAQHVRGGAALRAGEIVSLVALGFFGLGTFFLGAYLREALAMYSVFVLLALGVIFYTAVLCWLPAGGGGEAARA